MTLPTTRSLLMLTAMFFLLASGVTLGSSGLRQASRSAAAEVPGNPAFERTWARTDKPVTELRIDRTWIWGSEANTPVLDEVYAEAPNGRRQVHYFDKSRMEITHLDKQPDDPWYVANGLLVTELVTGRVQVGDAAFERRLPAEVNVAGDDIDPDSPTYATFLGLMNQPPLDDGASVVQRITRDGTILTDEALASFGVTAAFHVDESDVNHQVASVFWTFMNSEGLVYEDDALVTARLFESPFYATGYPIAEAYWATVDLKGVPTDVLIQCFQRRCLTYTPGNKPGWEVEAGNVGHHYYSWRYETVGESPTTTATTTATSTSTATATATSTGTATSTTPGQSTATQTNTPVNTPSSTATSTPTNTPTSTATNTPTNTPANTPTNTPTSTPTNTPTKVPTKTPTRMPTNTPTATPTTPSSGGGASASCLDSQESAFLTLLNDYRAANGLRPVTVSAKLNVAAHKHSADMGTNNFFSHTGFDGSRFSQRIQRAGYTSYSAAAENIAAGQSTAQAVFNSWKNSSGHNANMLNPSFTQIGIGFVQVNGSRYTSYWTTDFANGSDAAPSC